MFNTGKNILGPSFLGFKASEAEGNYMVATGGTVTTDGNYKIHTFTANGNFEITKLGDGLIQRFMCGGGGGGGISSFGVFGGGGGSAGQDLYDPALLMALGIYPVVIGAAGAGAAANNTDGTDGADTTFNGVTALKGIRGPGAFGANGFNGYNGSGGSSAGGLAGAGTNQNGGNAAPAQAGGGGGGGATGAGGSTVLGLGGTRGAGVLNSITGVSLEYCRGGRGGDAVFAAINGINYGSGGDGACLSISVAGNGSQGVVIIRYRYR